MGTRTHTLLFEVSTFRNKQPELTPPPPTAPVPAAEAAVNNEEEDGGSSGGEAKDNNKNNKKQDDDAKNVPVWNFGHCVSLVAVVPTTGRGTSVTALAWVPEVVTCTGAGSGAPAVGRSSDVHGSTARGLVLAVRPLPRRACYTVPLKMPSHAYAYTQITN